MPSGLAALLVATIPLWVVVLRASVGRERVGAPTYAGVALGLVGLAVLLLPGSRPASAGLGSMALLLVAALGWATGSYVSPRLTMPADRLVAVAWQLVFGGAGPRASRRSSRASRPTSTSARSACARGPGLAFLITFGSWLAYTSYNWLLGNVRISKVATYAYVNPVVAVILGFLVLGEGIATTALVGAALVIAAVVVIVRTESRGLGAHRALEQRRQHDLRLSPHDPRRAADALERLLQVRRVARADVDDRARLARDRVGGADLGVPGDGRAHLGGGHAALAVEGHDRVRRPAQRGRVDDRRVGPQHAVGLQAVDPPLDGRRAQRDALADGLERAARVGPQQRNDLPVDVVHTRIVTRFGATNRG